MNTVQGARNAAAALAVSGVLGGLVMLGCAGGARGHAEVARSPGNWGAADLPTPPPGYPAAGYPGAAAAEAPPAAAWPAATAPEPAPDRPGLGTEWGEARESPISEVSFLRAEPRHPFAVSEVFYDDREGVEAQAAYRGAPRFYDVPAARGAITISLRDANGDPLEAVRASSRVYVVGQEGQRYSIAIENHTGARYEAVATVDGLDVVSGRPGSFENRGYVLSPWSTVEIDGFRQSRDEVAAFRFARVRDSYAAARGNDRNVGVIGLAFFAERGARLDFDDLRLRDTASPFPHEGRFAPPPR
jgi:hypothetical protein